MATQTYVNYRLNHCIKDCSEGPRGSDKCDRSAKKIRICMKFDRVEEQMGTGIPQTLIPFLAKASVREFRCGKGSE
jgi:hypothetical protein